MTKQLLLRVVISLGASGCAGPTFTADPNRYTETQPLKITRTVVARDDDAVFRTYFVNWEGNEILIVSSDRYSEGEIVSVRVSDNPYPSGRYPHRLLSFTFLPSTSSTPMPPIDPEWALAQRRRARTQYQRVDLDVSEVYSARRGTAVFTAYLARWKGQDIVVHDSLSRDPLKTEGVLRVLIRKDEYLPGRGPVGHEPHRKLVIFMAPTAHWPRATRAR